MPASALDAQWRALDSHAHRLKHTKIHHLFISEPDRVKHFTFRVGPIFVDFSKQHIDHNAFESLATLFKLAEVPRHAQAMMRGEIVNRTEQRPALHTALRWHHAQEGGGADQAAARQAIRGRERMAKLVEEWHREADAGGQGLDVVHVGIGGSDIGPRLVCEALAAYDLKKTRLHFVNNVDGFRLSQLLPTLDPSRTKVCLVSKSFTTAETLLNGKILRQWLSARLGEAGVGKRLVAITANAERANEFGVDAERVLPLWDWVGGRFSLWSAVGLPIALQCGPDVFERLLMGAHQMDMHYADDPIHHNLPMLMAAMGVWNRNAMAHPSLAIAPYDDRLRLLPPYLQQLEMESNGKSVHDDGSPLTRPSVPMIWGDVGTNAQHAFFQALHQGKDVVPVDFIGVIRPAHPYLANHEALLANMLAQSMALMRGSGADAHRHDHLTPHRACLGNRPNSVILLDELTPEALGGLLALYEHKVHAQGCVWRLNSFDQWGVELGKRLADEILPALEGGVVPMDLDPSTRILISDIRDKLRG